MPRPCRTCRARKKACNGVRPECGTCRKSGRLCEGYEPHVKGVFVNLDAGSMNVRMKSHIGVAIDMAREDKPEPEHHRRGTSYTENGFLTSTYTAINTLDLSPAEFQGHFQALMARFRVDYARTSSCWSEGVSSLGLRSRVLDMALISLVTIRLSFTTEREQYLVFSLATYNTGLQSFRRLLQSSASECSPQLVVISLIFTLFEASQQQPTQIYSSGWAGHLTGALALLQCQGPTRFQTGGFHAAFKKLREMTILLVLSKRQTTFLTQPEWMETPWRETKKTRRDYLLDVAMQMTTLYALLHSNTTLDSPRQLSSQHQQLYSHLLRWRQTLLEAEPPTTPISCTCQESPNLPLPTCTCLPDPTKYPTTEYSYLAAEYTSILLLLSHIAVQLVSHIPTMNPKTTSLATRITILRTELQNILALPCFGRALSDTPGLTEGRCRALFPIWVLSETAPVVSIGDEEPDWWDGLFARVNYGVS